MELTVEKLQEIVTSAVKPMLEEQNKTISDVQTMVDDKVKEMASQFGRKPVITGGEDMLVQDPKGGFKSLSHFARDVYLAEKTAGRRISKELLSWEEVVRKTTPVTKAAGTGMSEGDSEYGGFLIPEEFRNDILMAVEQSNELLPRCMSVPMGASTIKIPYVNGFDESGGLVWGGIQWYWTDEEAAYSETRPKLGRVTLSLKKLTGLAYMSEEILEDSPVSMEQLLRRGFSDGLSFQINKVLIRGTGAGQPLGFLNAPCLISTTAETGQTAATIVYENILKMYAHSSNPGNSIWIANQGVLPQLATMSLAVGTGGAPVFLPANGASGTPYNTLMGRPIVWNNHCSALGTVGDILFVDLSQYLVGMKAGQGMGGRFDMSIHLKFDYGQVAYRFMFRIDGQPWWPTYLTPAQGTNYLSPLVALATRS